MVSRDDCDQFLRYLCAMTFHLVCVDNSFPREVAQGMGKNLDSRINMTMTDGSNEIEIQLQQPPR